MSGDWQRWLAARADAREQSALGRTLVPGRRDGAWVERSGRRLLDLSSNDYLGLAGHPALVEAAARAARDRGAGARASRLVSGHDPAVAALEERLAAFEGCERALVLGSGYLANVGTIAALCDRHSAVVSDRLNHASIVDGIRLAGARHLRYGHADPGQLEAQLARARREGATRVLVVTDGVFSMDGDRAPLPELLQVAERYGAAVLVDDAHGGGVLGPHGEGLAHEQGVAERIDVRVGTFSKAFGVYGGYVAGGAAWIEHLVNACRPLVYSTGLPPAVVGAVDAALDLVRDAHSPRLLLREHADRLRAALAAAELDTGRSTTQIVPLVVGCNEAAVALGSRLEARGVLGVAIRPPTVPPGSARIRFSLSAAIGPHDLDAAIAAIVEEARCYRGQRLSEGAT